MEAERDTEPRYPIGAVARRTGLSTHVLRAWERRYSVVEPRRSGGGTRLYSGADVVRLRLLRRLTEAGHSIGQLAPLPLDALLSLAREADGAGGAPPQEARRDRVGDRYVAACLEATEAMDGGRVHAVLMRAAVAMSALEVAEEVLVPLLRRVGELWEEGEYCPAHEHMVSVCVQRVLHWLMDALAADPGAPALVCTTPAGEWHEIGAMLAGVMAADAGWRVVYLGPDLPADDIVRAVRASGADVVALSVVRVDGASPVREELSALRSRLPARVRLLVGGAAAAELEGLAPELDAVWFDDLRGLREALSAMHPAQRTERR